MIFHDYSLNIAVVAALPWIVAPVVNAVRAAGSDSLNTESVTPPTDPPGATAIIPARNEAANIVQCLESFLRSTYPALTIVVVDDHSDDATFTLASDIARKDPRVTVITSPPLPSGWFGKQWACQNGAAATSADILIFVDADTRAGPDLVTRSVNGMQRTRADLYTVVGRQQMLGFWERLIQPQVFAILATRYGGTKSVNRSRHASDKIANGQYLMVRHSAYTESGGHASVRSYVAEDLMLAQRFFAAGRTTAIVMGRDQLSTRMYTSLGELIRGWRKNIYAGGRDAMPFGRVGQLVFPLGLQVPALMQLAPVIVLCALAFGRLGPAAAAWAGITLTALLAWWLLVYWFEEQPVYYALLFPLGAAVLLYISVSAMARGSRVEWKGRQYTSLHVAAHK